MTDAQFFQSFRFRQFRYRCVHHTDSSGPGGCSDHYLARMISGRAKITSGSVTLYLEAGDVFYIPKGLQYRSWWYPEPGGSVAFFSFAFQLFPLDGSARCALQKLSCTPPQRQLLETLEQELTVSAASVGTLYWLMGLLLPGMETEAVTSGERILSKATEYMARHPHCRIRDVAKYCGTSESGLYTSFRTHLGKTPVQVQHRLLCDKARELLSATDLTVEEISNRLGFSSTAYFRKIFRAQTGTTPTDYRKRPHSM